MASAALLRWGDGAAAPINVSAGTTLSWRRRQHFTMTECARSISRQRSSVADRDCLSEQCNLQNSTAFVSAATASSLPEQAGESFMPSRAHATPCRQAHSASHSMCFESSHTADRPSVRTRLTMRFRSARIMPRAAEASAPPVAADCSSRYVISVRKAPASLFRSPVLGGALSSCAMNPSISLMTMDLSPGWISTTSSQIAATSRWSCRSSPFNSPSTWCSACSVSPSWR
mmetsp:Transcript_49414/g.160149  ORF Transcript_49414/g.160149 Transcript_49414/m.160149 type:complete len:230 (-) Transcript_49414:948-1637(-)